MNKKDNVNREKELKEMYIYISANDVLDRITGLRIYDDRCERLRCGPF